MFSGPVLSLLDISNNLATLAWIPLALWCAAEGAWRRGGLVLALAFRGAFRAFRAGEGCPDAWDQAPLGIDQLRARSLLEREG